MNNSQVAHLWAAQSKEHGRGSNFYFEGRTIYSYGPHFPIATFTDSTTEDGRRIVLFTTDRYGQATSKHICYASQALSGLNVRVIDVCAVNRRDNDNLRDMRARYDAAVLKASRARSYGEGYLTAARDIRADATEYARAFGLDMPEFPLLDDALLDRVRQAAAKDAQERAQRTRERSADMAKDYAVKLAEWRAGTRDSLPWNADAPTALRLSADAARVETSRGAEITLHTAHQLWAWLYQAFKPGQNFELRRAQILAKFADVDGFAMRDIRADGSVVIGCHTLEYAEMSAFAASQGWPT